MAALGLAILICLLDYLPWVFVIVVLTLLYRVVRLRSLPWLAADYLLSLFTGSLTAWLFRQVTPPVSQLNLALHSNLHSLVLPPNAFILIGTEIIESAIGALVALLVLSEVIVLVDAQKPLRAGLLRWLVRIHEHVKAMGIILLVLTVIRPLPVLIFWLVYTKGGQ